MLIRNAKKLLQSRERTRNALDFSLYFTRDDRGDIYIMMQCVCVFMCHEKSSLPTSELSAGGAKWPAC